MTEQDWTAPPKSDPPAATSRPVKWLIWDNQNRDRGFCIYAVPQVGPARLVASDLAETDAELIVSLYEKWRGE